MTSRNESGFGMIARQTCVAIYTDDFANWSVTGSGDVAEGPWELSAAGVMTATGLAMGRNCIPENFKRTRSLKLVTTRKQQHFTVFVIWYMLLAFAILEVHNLLTQGTRRIIFSALEGRRQNYEPNFRESSINNRIICLYLTSLYFACGLIICIVATRAVSDCSKLQNC